MKVLKIVATLVALVALSFSSNVFASTSVVVDHETFGPFTMSSTGGPINSGGSVGSPDNSFVTTTSVGGYLATTVTVSGTLDNTTGFAGTFGSEADLSIATTGAGTFVAQGGVGGTYTPPLAVPGTVTTRPAFDPGAGPMTIEFFESFDDGAGTDQTWLDVTVKFSSTVVTNGMFAAGALPTDGTMVMYTTPVVSGGLDFYTFSIGAGGVGAPGSYLNLQARTPAGGSSMDTEMALYNSAGTMVNFGSTTYGTCVSNNDDGQVTANGGLHGMLSYGIADPLALAAGTGTSCNSGDTDAGEHGATLAAGSYTLVVGGFNTTFSEMIGGITPGTATGSYDLKMTYFVPEPTTIGLLLVGLIGLLTCRRK